MEQIDHWIMEQARKYVDKAGFSEIMELAYKTKYRELIAEEKQKEKDKENATAIV